MYNFNSLDQFETIVEQFEICDKLFKKLSIPKARICIILLDNIVELLILRILQDKFSDSDYFKWVIKPELSLKDRDSFLRYFDEKIKHLKNYKIVGKNDIEIIKILHKYRNLAFHNDKHNSNTIKLFARLLFSSSLNLFVNSQNQNSIGFGKRRLKWLKKYDLKKDRIEYSNAAKAISKKIGLKRKPTNKYIKTILSNDLLTCEYRLLSQNILSNQPCPLGS